MGLESYNYLLFPIGGNAILGDDGWEIFGAKKLLMDNIQRALYSIPNVRRDRLVKIWPGDSDECYFEYYDGDCIIEFEINAGYLAMYVDEISVRYSLLNPIDTYDKAVMICNQLADMLSLLILDMHAGQILYKKHEVVNVESKHSYQKKRCSLLEMFQLPCNYSGHAVHCGHESISLLE